MDKNKLTLFERRVLEKLKDIPAGRVTTYSELARALNRPQAARAVGNALHKNPFAPRVPCHRVVKKDGRLGGYGGGTDKKVRLLRAERVEIKNGRVARFSEKLYRFS